MTAAERARVQSLAQRIGATNQKRIAWTGRILETLPDGPGTRRECLALIHPSAGTEDRKAFADALSRLLRAGRVQERPMIKPAGRAVRVEPVMVLEVVR